jgi:hypothetical protein
MSTLSAIADKEPVVSTFGADALAASPASVRQAYDWHAVTYVEQPAVADLRRSFLEAIRAGITPKACLVAPFGYGKTSTAIGIWHACRESGVLAVPPISCGSFTDIARAVFDWLLFSLPDQRQRIVAAHEQFLVRSAEALARRDEREYRIPFDQGLAAIRDKLERGYLDFEDVSVNLLSFLEEATMLAKHAGYSGLVVVIDEMQQLLGNASKGALVALRQLIWGLRTRELPLGLLLTMDPETEGTLADRAGDILHRIKDDGLYLDIRHVYNREFPARLWAQYERAFDLTSTGQAVIDRPTLDALGQLCERDDLSNGPRTVINVFRRAAERAELGLKASYSPIHLIEDILSGDIRFAGDRSVLRGLLVELLDYPYFQRSPERTCALKLIAAFPRGCPPHVAENYGLAATCQVLDDDLRGEIVTELDEGLALIDLQRVGRPANRLNILLRRYWMQLTDQELFAEDAPQVFAELVLPLLFLPRLHDLRGWSPVSEIRLQADGTYSGVLEGTFSPSYPLRRVAITVLAANQAVPGESDDEDVDYRLRFRLDLRPQAQSSLIVTSATGEIEFTLAPARPVERGLGASLAWIEHYLSPQPISAAMVLSLLRYFARQESSEENARDQARIEDAVARLRGWLLAELFGHDVFSGAGYRVTQAGAGALQEFLYLFARQRWPAYRPLMVHQHWAALVDNYAGALAQAPPAARTGVRSVSAPKSEIAKLFGQDRHAGFESRARQYGDLLHIELWRGDEGAIRFKPHPAELEIARLVREKGRLEQRDAYRTLRSQGFSAQEAAQLLLLAHARGLIREQGPYLLGLDAPDGAELLARARSLMARWNALSDKSSELGLDLEAIMTEVQHQGDLVELGWRLEALEEQVARIEERLRTAEQAHWQEVRTKLLLALPQLVPLSPPHESGELANHLHALFSLLDAERRQLNQAADAVVATDEASMAANATALTRRIATWVERASSYERWIDLARRLVRLQLALRRLGADVGKLKEINDQIAGLAKEGRVVLARAGVGGIHEVSRLDATLLSIEAGFQQAATERRAAYEQVLARLSVQLSEVLEATPPALPPYDAADDEGSIRVLHRAVADAVSRFVAFLQVYVAGTGGSKIEKLARAKLRTDIQAVARRATDPEWLLDGQNIEIRQEVIRSIRSLRARVSRTLATPGALDRGEGLHLARALMSLPAGPIDLREVFEQTEGIATRAEIIAELLHLMEQGTLRISIDLSEVASRSY